MDVGDNKKKKPPAPWCRTRFRMYLDGHSSGPWSTFGCCQRPFGQNSLEEARARRISAYKGVREGEMQEDVFTLCRSVSVRDRGGLSSSERGEKRRDRPGLVTS